MQEFFEKVVLPLTERVGVAALLILYMYLDRRNTLVSADRLSEAVADLGEKVGVLAGVVNARNGK